MLYLLFEIWIWVVAAGLVGGIFGWWLRGMRARREVAREAMLWQRRLDRLETTTAEQHGPETADRARSGESAD